AGELRGERLLGQLDRLLEAGGYALPLFLVDLGRDPQQVAGRLDGREVPLDAEQPADLGRVVGRVVQPAQAAARVSFYLLVDGVQAGLRLLQLVAEAFQGVHEGGDVGLAEEPHPGLGVGQAHAAPVVDDAGADGGEAAEGFVADVENPFAGGEE